MASESATPYAQPTRLGPRQAARAGSRTRQRSEPSLEGGRPWNCVFPLRMDLEPFRLVPPCTDSKCRFMAMVGHWIRRSPTPASIWRPLRQYQRGPEHRQRLPCPGPHRDVSLERIRSDRNSSKRKVDTVPPSSTRAARSTDSGPPRPVPPPRPPLLRALQPFGPDDPDCEGQAGNPILLGAVPDRRSPGPARSGPC